MNTFSRVATLMSLLAISLNATSLDVLIEKALQEHPSLEAIEQRINASEQNILLSRKFTNPKLSFSVNDIQTNDLNNRSIERMQTSVVTIEQKLPFFGKRDAKEERERLSKRTQELMLEDAKAQLVSKIKQSSYRVWELTTLYSIICKFEELTKQSIELNAAYTATRLNQHMGIMSASMSLSDLRIKKNRLLQALESEYAKLSYLTTQKVSNVELNLEIHKMPNLEKLTKELVNNYAIQAFKSNIKEAQATLKLKNLDHYPDPTIKAGYFYRNSYEDYLSVAIGAALPIYGSEELKSEYQRKIVLERRNALSNIVQKIQSELETYYALMKQSFVTHTILTKESMPQIEHMFDLSSSKIASGGDLFKYIDLIEQELELEEQRISAVSQYHQYEAKIEALLGVQK